MAQAGIHHHTSSVGLSSSPTPSNARACVRVHEHMLATHTQRASACTQARTHKRMHATHPSPPRPHPLVNSPQELETPIQRLHRRRHPAGQPVDIAAHAVAALVRCFAHPILLLLLLLLLLWSLCALACWPLLLRVLRLVAQVAQHLALQAERVRLQLFELLAEGLVELRACKSTEAREAQQKHAGVLLELHMHAAELHGCVVMQLRVYAMVFCCIVDGLVRAHA